MCLVRSLPLCSCVQLHSHFIGHLPRPYRYLSIPLTPRRRQSESYCATDHFWTVDRLSYRYGGVVMLAAVMHSVAQSAIVTDCSAIGFVASALVLAAFGMKDMVNLRIVAIWSNVAFIAYAVMLNLPPILILHVILFPLNGWRLAQELQS